MNDLVTSYIDEQLEIMVEWDIDSITDALRISPTELLNVSEFRNRAEQWIMANAP